MVPAASTAPRAACTFHGKGDVRKAVPVDRGRWPFLLVVVLKYLQRRPLLAVAGETQVHTPYLGSGDSRPVIQPLPGEISLWGHRRAPQDLLVKVGQSPPVLGDDVGMDEFRLDGQNTPRLRTTHSRRVLYLF